MDVTEGDRVRGDAARFERLYDEHFERVAAYLLARVDRDGAADALAATFEVAWRRIADVPSAELPWLLGVARRVLASAWPPPRGRSPVARRMPGLPRSSRAQSRS